MLDTMKLAVAEILSPRFRSLLVKSLALSFVLLGVVWLALFLVYRFVLQPWLIDRGWLVADSWFALIVTLLVGAAFFVLVAILTLPVLRFVAGNYMEEVASLIEKEHYPERGPARAVPISETAGDTARFAVRTTLTNLVLLPLAIVPVAGPIAVFLVNANMVGREYFHLTSIRRRERAETDRLIAQNRWTVWAAGGAIVAVSAIPLVNLFAPTFGTALMLHVEERVSPA